MERRPEFEPPPDGPFFTREDHLEFRDGIELEAIPSHPSRSERSSDTREGLHRRSQCRRSANSGALDKASEASSRLDLPRVEGEDARDPVEAGIKPRDGERFSRYGEASGERSS